MAVLKYEPLQRWLAARASDRAETTFSAIDEIVTLPASARRHMAYWYGAASTSPTHTWKRAWEMAGYTVETVDLAAERVTFRRFD